MIKYVSKMFVAPRLLTAFDAVTAKAQIESDVTLEANIPFPFTVNNTTLPGGKYEVKMLDSNELGVLEIRDQSGRIAVIFETENTQANQAPNRANWS